MRNHSKKRRRVFNLILSWLSAWRSKGSNPQPYKQLTEIYPTVENFRIVSAGGAGQSSDSVKLIREVAVTPALYVT